MAGSVMLSDPHAHSCCRETVNIAANDMLPKERPSVGGWHRKLSALETPYRSLPTDMALIPRAPRLWL